MASKKGAGSEDLETMYNRVEGTPARVGGGGGVGGGGRGGDPVGMSAGPGGAEPLQRIDLHTHTFYSPDGITSPKRFVEACRRKGLTCVAVTDHNTIRGAL